MLHMSRGLDGTFEGDMSSHVLLATGTLLFRLGSEGCGHVPGSDEGFVG